MEPPSPAHLPVPLPTTHAHARPPAHVPACRIDCLTDCPAPALPADGACGRAVRRLPRNDAHRGRAPGPRVPQPRLYEQPVWLHHTLRWVGLALGLNHLCGYIKDWATVAKHLGNAYCPTLCPQGPRGGCGTVCMPGRAPGHERLVQLPPDRACKCLCCHAMFNNPHRAAFFGALALQSSPATCAQARARRPCTLAAAS